MKGIVKISRTAEYDEDNMNHGTNYAFFHRPQCQSLPPRWYQRVISSATRSIDIWDPYFNYNDNDEDNDCRLFKYLRCSVKMRFLVVESDDKFNSKFRDWEPSIANMITTALKPGMDISFSYISPNTELGAKWEFHDRFLIVDNDRVFLVGSSVGYQLSPKASTGMYELINDEDKKLVTDMFELYWTFAKNQKHLKQIAL